MPAADPYQSTYRPVVGTRWKEMIGTHVGSFVQVVRATANAVTVVKVGEQVNMSRKARQHGGKHRIDIERWRTHYRPATARDERLCAVQPDPVRAAVDAVVPPVKPIVIYDGES